MGKKAKALLGVAAIGAIGLGAAKALAGGSKSTEGAMSLKVKKGQSAVITVQLEPMTQEAWQRVMKDPSALTHIISKLFPTDGAWVYQSFTVQPAVGVFSVVLQAKRDISYRSRTQTIGDYTVTTVGETVL